MKAKKARSTSRYLNLFSDRAFLRVFGSERDKSIPLSFLNAILEPSEQIIDFHFGSTHNICDNPADRGIVIDLQCITTDGRRIIIELQKRPQINFRERTLYYSTWPIQQQGRKGKWDYAIKAVLVIALMDFIFDSNASDTRIVTRKIISDSLTHQLWTDKLQFLCIELPRFNKTLPECVNQEEKWFFVLKNLHRLMTQPAELQEEVFAHLFEITDKTRFEIKERERFENSEQEYDIMKNALDYAINKERELRLEEQVLRLKEQATHLNDKIATIQHMLAEHFDWALIQKITGVAEADFPALLKKAEGAGKQP